MSVHALPAGSLRGSSGGSEGREKVGSFLRSELSHISVFFLGCSLKFFRLAELGRLKF